MSASIYPTLAIILVCIGCSTRGSKDQTDQAIGTNSVKFSRTEIMDDATFTVRAIDDGLWQVQAARLAKKQAQNQDVLQLAELMLEDHEGANKELRRIANQLNISFPVELGTDNQKDLNSLLSLNGLAFDEAYTKLVMQRNRTMIESFTRESEMGAEPTLRKWAGSKIIILEMDQEMTTRAKAAVDRRR